MSKILKAPFSPEHVVALNAWQQRDNVHPYTCIEHARQDHRLTDGALFATVRGWICPYCDYTQDWAHASIADRQPR